MYLDFDKEIGDLEELLMELDEWDIVPDSDFSIGVGRQKGFSFEIRTREACHNYPHFHVKLGEKSGSYKIDPVTKLAGNFSNKEDKMIIAWGMENQKKLIGVWNKIHTDKQIQEI